LDLSIPQLICAGRRFWGSLPDSRRLSGFAASTANLCFTADAERTNRRGTVMPYRIGSRLALVALAALGAMVLSPGASLGSTTGPAPTGSPNIVVTPPTITSSSSTTFTVGTAGTFSVTTGGLPVPAISESGALPTGVTFVDNHNGTATLAGTPATGTGGGYPITIGATNAAPPAASQEFTLTVDEAPAFTTADHATFYIGEAGLFVARTDPGYPGLNSIGVVDPSSPPVSPVPSVAAGTVTFSGTPAAGSEGSYQYTLHASNGIAIQQTFTLTVSLATTATSVVVHPTSITAAVAPIAPAVGNPAGTVTFYVDGVSVGTAPLTGGAAVLAYIVPSGKAQQVAAVYGGEADYTGSSASTARNDPVLISTSASAHSATKYHWYRSPVTVTFHCAANTAALTSICPTPVTLRKNGAAQRVTRTITAADGGATTLTVSGINVDKTKPNVRISGPRKGHTYSGSAPKAHCVATDSLSGIASCRLKRITHGNKTTITAAATDKAGNVRRTTLSYFT
jgi:hypothetical protein